jgi:hypothetical protein
MEVSDQLPALAILAQGRNPPVLVMEATPWCYLLNKLHLRRRTQHRFILIAQLCPLCSLSKGLRKTTKTLKNHPLSRSRFEPGTIRWRGRCVTTWDNLLSFERPKVGMRLFQRSPVDNLSSNTSDVPFESRSCYQLSFVVIFSLCETAGLLKMGNGWLLSNSYPLINKNHLTLCCNIWS